MEPITLSVHDVYSLKWTGLILKNNNKIIMRPLLGGIKLLSHLFKLDIIFLYQLGYAINILSLGRIRNAENVVIVAY